MEKGIEKTNEKLVNIAMLVLKRLVYENRLSIEDKGPKVDILLNLFRYRSVIFPSDVFGYTFNQTIFKNLDFLEEVQVENGIGVRQLNFDLDKFLKSKSLREFIQSEKDKYDSRMNHILESTKKQVMESFQKFDSILETLKIEGALSPEEFNEENPESFIKKAFEA